MQAKLAPVRTTTSGVTTQAAVNFPGFQQIFDFTSAGSESSVTATGNGDTDKEYKIVVRNLGTGAVVRLRLNADTGANYGYQFVQNLSGTITANRATNATSITLNDYLSSADCALLTPAGFIKTCFKMNNNYTSGTTMAAIYLAGHSWNNTANVTSLGFSTDTGNFTAGTRITVFARRSNV